MRVKTLGELSKLVAEYQLLPDDLTAQLNWAGIDRLPDAEKVCRQCGEVYGHWLVDMDEALRWVERGEFYTQTQGYCPTCYGVEVGEDEDDEEVGR